MPEKVFRVSSPERVNAGSDSPKLIMAKGSLDGLSAEEYSRLLDTLGAVGLGLGEADQEDVGISLSDFSEFAVSQGQGHLAVRAWNQLKNLQALAERHESTHLPDVFIDRETLSYNALNRVIQEDKLVTHWMGVEIGPKLGKLIEGAVSSVSHLAPPATTSK